MSRSLVWIVGIALIALIFMGVFFSIVKDKRGDVAIVSIEGMIFNPDHFIQQMEKLRRDKSIKAVVLRIDSPGGAVAAGQEMTAEVKRFASQKPVVVSMGNVAASAGYYIASAANYIIASPGTITASIGVRMEHAEIEKLLTTLGIKLENLKSGALKDIGTYDRPMTAEERAVLEGILSQMHEQFIAAVAENRKLPEEDVRRVADGRPLTGADALSYKLIDALGGEQDAVTKAGELARISGEPKVRRMKAGPPWWYDLMFDSMLSLSKKFLSTINYALSTTHY